MARRFRVVCYSPAVTGPGLRALVMSMALAAGPAPQNAPDRAALCGSVDQPRVEAARTLAPLGEAGRTALLELAGATTLDDAACGVAGLAALRDRRVVAPLKAALSNPAWRGDAYRFARWAAFAAGGPETDLGAAYLPLVHALADPAAWTAAGDDAIRLLGKIDAPAARDRLVAEFARPQPDATLDALIDALGEQGDPRAHDRAAALGQEAIGARSGNLTYEQASRIGAVAAYLLATGPGTRSDGLQLLRQLAPRDQEDVAARVVQTWCERALRRPAEREAAEAARTSLVAELEREGLRWSHLLRGAFVCPPAR